MPGLMELETSVRRYGLTRVTERLTATGAYKMWSSRAENKHRNKHINSPMSNRGENRQNRQERLQIIEPRGRAKSTNAGAVIVKNALPLDQLISGHCGLDGKAPLEAS
jgi:hypothetical protein